MKIDTTLLTTELAEMPHLTRLAEEIGFDGLWASETAHDSFFPLVLSAEHSSNLELGNAIAVAFARSPATLAYMAWDLAKFSEGRFMLGLGTQVKGHIQRRFGMTWEQPVAKMRETILAIRAFWECWQNGTKLNFRGEFYKLTLMSPFFNPGPHDYPDIPIYIAGVNENMCRLGGELCEGFHVHPFHTAHYLREFVLPNIETGLKKGERRREDITLSSTVFVIPTDDAEKAQQYEAEVRQQISFYASTPQYRIVFKLHGWQDVAEELSGLAARGKWQEMPALITDEILDTVAVRGTWAELPSLLKAKYADGLLDRVSYYMPFTPGEMDEQWRITTAGFKA